MVLQAPSLSMIGSSAGRAPEAMPGIPCSHHFVSLCSLLSLCSLNLGRGDADALLIFGHQWCYFYEMMSWILFYWLKVYLKDICLVNSWTIFLNDILWNLNIQIEDYHAFVVSFDTMNILCLCFVFLKPFTWFLTVVLLTEFIVCVWMLNSRLNWTRRQTHIIMNLRKI